MFLTAKLRQFQRCEVSKRHFGNLVINYALSKAEITITFNTCTSSPVCHLLPKLGNIREGSSNMIDICMALDQSVSPHTGVRTIQNTGVFWQAVFQPPRPYSFFLQHGSAAKTLISHPQNTASYTGYCCHCCHRCHCCHCFHRCHLLSLLSPLSVLSLLSLLSLLSPLSPLLLLTPLSMLSLFSPLSPLSLLSLLSLLSPLSLL